MIKPILKISYHTTVVLFEITVGLVLLFLVLIGVGFWKLSQGPVDMTFAAQTIKKAIVSSDHVTDLHFDSIVAEWKEFSGPIAIGLSGVRLSEEGKPVLNIPQLGFRIAKAPLLIGRIKPEAIIARDATVKLLRAKNGGVRLLLTSTPDPPTAAPPPTIDTSIKALGEAFFKGGTLPDYHQIAPLSKIERFSVERAHVMIVDEETGKGWNIPALDFELLRQDNEFSIVAHYQQSNAPASNASFLLQRNPEDGTIKAYGEIDAVNASVLSRLFLPVDPLKGPQFIVKSKIEAALDKEWNIQTLEGDVLSDSGEFHLKGLIDSPITFSNLSAHLVFDKKAQKIMLRDSQVDINKRTLLLSGEKDMGQGDSLFRLLVNIPDITFDDIHLMWPENHRKSIAADWLTHRMSKGKVSNVEIILPIDINHPDMIDTTLIEGRLAYEGLSVDYRAPLAPVSNGRGTATLKNDVLTVKVDSGVMGGMTIKEAVITIPHLTHPTTVGDAMVDATMSGAIADVLRYIATEPIALDDEIGINPATVKGTATFNAKVSFPAIRDLPKDRVHVTVYAQLFDVLLPRLVRGMDVTGGPFNLEVDSHDTVRIEGRGALGGQALSVDYSQPIQQSTASVLTTIKADIVANRFMREKFGINLDSFVTGDVPVSIDYQELRGGTEKISLRANATPAILTFKPFRYTKPVGKTAEARADVTIQNGAVQVVDNLAITIAKEGTAKGRITFGRAGNIHDVKQGRFSTFTLAGANNFALDFTQTAQDVYDVTIKGKQLDGRPFLGKSKEVKNKPSLNNGKTSDSTRVNASVFVDRIKTGDKETQYLYKPRLSLRTDAQGDVAFLDLKADLKSGMLSVSIKPNQAGRSELRVTSDNAGEVLRTLDIYDTMIGGAMDIRGSQIAGGGVNDIAGRAVLSNFTVVKAPVLAKLINLFSLSGLTELLQNKGIAFKTLKTDFQWKDSAQGRVIAVQNGRTTGASIGLTFGGTINQDKGHMDISGTFVPMSEVNKFVNKIPIIGRLLTGGSNGGVIAATYSMKGKSSDPTVLINPLSVLTPGFLRSFLFEGDKNIFDDEAEEASSKPEKKRAVNQ